MVHIESLYKNPLKQYALIYQGIVSIKIMDSIINPSAIK